MLIPTKKKFSRFTKTTLKLANLRCTPALIESEAKSMQTFVFFCKIMAFRVSGKKTIATLTSPHIFSHVMVWIEFNIGEI